MPSNAPAPNAHTSVLRTLHRIHRQLTDLKERFSRGPKQIKAAEVNVQHCEENLAKIKADAKTMRMAADQKQLQLKSGEEKVKDHQRKLNAAASNREYQLLKEQIAADEMANSVLADEILEAFEAADGVQKQVAEAEAVLVSAKERVEELRGQVAAQEPSLNADIARLEAELQKEEATLPEDIRDMYQRVVQHKGEDALAAVENQFCNGCNQQITLNLYTKVILGAPVFCKSCGRLLYLPEPK
jgi:predicted  nucleic acid-binding Zn-ribbon protein